MPVDRPTFSESWYRVAELRPRLRSSVQVHRQHYRGRMWHVLQDPTSNQFFRLNEAAYRFVGLLDGRRTVAEVWRICQDQLGDSAPTQGEAIQLLGQLYTSNLLYADLPPDAEGLFKRYQRRIRREVQSYLMNLLFIRIPLLDPDNFLNAWIGAVGWLFSWVGLVLWLGIVGTGLYFVLNNWSQLYDLGDSVLDPENLPLLYLSFAIIKVVHEFGHAFLCKAFGKRTGTGGEVHVMGVMFLVFTPLPYVDASSAWAFRSRSQRVLVGLGGMLVEMALAAIAAVIWANIGPGTLRTICYNAMFVAGVSTILFNANPLLRYDGYYVLSDLLEIPNLAQRSKQYLYYLVRKYAWNVRQARDPAHTRGEKAWFIFYGVASTIYRVLICVNILLFVASKLFMVGVILAAAAAVAWVLVPLGKFVHYLATNGELARVRGRAIASTLAVAALLVGGVGFLRAPDRFRLEGLADWAAAQIVHAETDGFVRSAMASGRQVSPGGEPLLVAQSPDLEAEYAQLEASLRRLEARRRMAQAKDPAAAQIVAEQIAALRERLDYVRTRRQALSVHAAMAGQWISPQADRARGAFLRRGEAIGMVAGGEVIIRATAGQDIVDRILEDPIDRFTLIFPAARAAVLEGIVRSLAEGKGQLQGTMVSPEHPDQPMAFAVERIEPPGDDVESVAESQPANPPASQPATAAATAPAAEPSTAGSGTRIVRIRLLAKAPQDQPLLAEAVNVWLAGQEFHRIPALREVNWRGVEIRMKGSPDPLMTGTITRIIEAGRDQLPSAALGYGAGGSIQTDPKDPKGVKAAERFFEILIRPDPVQDKDSPWHGRLPFLAGQRVVVRVEMPPRPLIQQWYRSLLQLVQRRFRI